MTPNRWSIEYYETGTGECPVAEFIDSLSDEEAVLVLRKIDLLEEMGPRLDRPHSGYLRDKIHELRAKVRRSQLRILYFRVGDLFVLSHGLRKRSGRVRDSEIDMAVKHRTDYLSRP